jgi:hypothetical protein
VSKFGEEAGSSFASAWSKTMAKDPWSLMRNPQATIGRALAATGDAFSMDDVMKATNTHLADALKTLMAPAKGLRPNFRNTDLPAGAADAVAAMAPGIAMGLTALTGGSDSSLSKALGAMSGGKWPPKTYEQVIDRILGMAGRHDLLEGGKVDVTKAKYKPVLDDMIDVAALMKNLGTIDSNAITHSVKKSNPDFADISIVKNGSHYTVMIPSTLAWAPSGTHAPNDITSNLQALSTSHTSDLMSAVRRAIAMEKIPPGSQVMLSGFSQGGIAAAALAEQYGQHPDPSFRVAAVVTFGAPVARFEIPNTTQVLSIEHNQDVVPALDGASNPDKPNWTTLKSDVDPKTAAAGALMPAHDALSYAATAKLWDNSKDPALKSFEINASKFFATSNSDVDKDGTSEYSESNYEAKREPVKAK